MRTDIGERERKKVDELLFFKELFWERGGNCEFFFGVSAATKKMKKNSRKEKKENQNSVQKKTV